MSKKKPQSIDDHTIDDHIRDIVRTEISSSLTVMGLLLLEQIKKAISSLPDNKDRPQHPG